MSVFHAIVLGTVQGLTEFLPISSSAHLIIVPWLFGWGDPGLAFDAAIHLGTLAAAIIYFWREILAMLQALPRALSRPKALLLSSGQEGTDEDPRDRDARLALLIAIATIPGGIIGLLAESRIDDYYHTSGHRDRSIIFVAIMLATLAVILWLAERLSHPRRSIWRLRLPDAITIGLAQAAAVIPGISRSGVTITTGLFRDLRRADAARYSFLLGIPIIAGAGSKKLLDVIQAGMTRGEVDAFAAGIITSAIVGFIAIWGLLRYLQRSRTTIFIVYRIAAAVLLLVLVAFR